MRRAASIAQAALCVCASGLMVFAAPTRAATTESWWQSSASEDTSLTIDAQAPISLRQVYGLRVSASSFCGVSVSHFGIETIYGIRGAADSGRLVVAKSEPLNDASKRFANDAAMQRTLAELPKNLAPTELLVSPTSLVQRVQPHQRPRGLLDLFVPASRVAPSHRTVMAGYCGAK